MKVFLKSLIAAVVVTALLAGGYIFLTSAVFRLREIRVEPNQVAAIGSPLFEKIRKDIEYRLRPLSGQRIWNVDLDKVLAAVEKDLRIKEVKISRLLPNTLQITVEPHSPIAQILDKDNELVYPVARSGEMLPPMKILEAPDSPYLRGRIFLENESVRMSAVELISQLEEAGALSQRAVSEVYYDKKLGFRLVLQSGGAEVWLGFDDFGGRLKQAARVAEYLKSEQLQGRVIDARFTKKVVVRLRNEP